MTPILTVTLGITNLECPFCHGKLYLSHSDAAYNSGIITVEERYDCATCEARVSREILKG